MKWMRKEYRGREGEEIKVRKEMHSRTYKKYPR
jgi:hypothetical protein